MKTQVLTACFAMTTAMAGAAIAAEAAVDGVVETEFVEVPAVEPKGAARIAVLAKPAEEFFAKLTNEEIAAAGLGKLSEAQRAALNTQVAKEVRLARQGDVRGFAGTFISRRTEEERGAAGLGVLTTSEKYQLDRLVSRALASREPQPPISITRPPSDSELLLKTKSDWETHGFVQLEYGFGSGDREYKAGTVAVEQVNVKTGTAFTFAYTAVEGDGLWYCRDYSMGWRSRPFGRWRY